MAPQHISPCFPPGSRLGNHLFAIATAYAYARRQGLECRVPWEECESSRMLHTFLGDVLPPTASGRNEFNIQQDTTVTYTPIPDGLADGGLWGFFQSPKYFDEYRQELRELFAPFIAPVEEGSLGVHIRLGDYLELRNTFYVVNGTYLRNVRSLLSPGIRKVVLFTDDPERAKKMLRRLKLPATVETEVDASAPCEAIRRMTAMSELVISSSSFSWWGAYLGAARRVYAPRDWYVRQDAQNHDIHAEGWIRVPNLSWGNYLERIPLIWRILCSLDYRVNKLLGRGRRT